MWDHYIMHLNAPSMRAKHESHESPECTKDVDWKVTHLYNLVFLWFVDLSCQTTAWDGIMDDELIGLEAWLLVEFRSWNRSFIAKIQMLDLWSWQTDASTRESKFTITWPNLNNRKTQNSLIFCEWCLPMQNLQTWGVIYLQTVCHR